MMLTHLSILLLLGLGALRAQNCPNPPTLPPPPACTSCTPLTVDPHGNASVPNNQSRCVPSHISLSVNNLSIGNNATLIVCGQLALNGWLNLNNGASVWVGSSGTFSGHGANINTHSAFYNYGVVNLSGSLNLNGAHSQFYNIGTGAQLNVGGDITVNSSDGLINYGGQIHATHLRINGSGSICVANGACFSGANFTSNGNSTITVVGSTPAAIHFTSNSTINGGSVTSSSNLYVCQAPGATQSGSGTWGTAQITTNCTGGCGVLAYGILRIKAHIATSSLSLRWEVEGSSSWEIKTCSILIEQKGSWVEVGRTTASTYTIELKDLPQGDEWTFQVRGYGADGMLLVLGQTRVSQRREDNSFMVYPTIFSHELRYRSEGEYNLFLFNAMGQMVGRYKVQRGAGVWHSDEDGTSLASLPAGMYILCGEGVAPVRLWKQP
ncbi:MAG: hypothetical protein RMK19_00035 [Bacteroidia bacterium]|nr:hypothetical protein [Bacteroidia bacterium]MDW8014388.1 hypothetical protein [Bacteroidia bacterium]